ncbi:MAG: polyhydroxyalkanoic acid system family protein [Polyangiaceae bacterium]
MSHDLPEDLARAVAEHAFASYKEKYAKYQPTLTWRTDTRAEASFQAKGITLKGSIELTPGQIAFDLDVPFVLRVFKSQAFDVMDRELRTWVAKAKAGELCA